MGMLTSYAIYRTGKRKGARSTAKAVAVDIDELTAVCEHCGYMAMQHSQDGRMRCPTYPSI